MGETNSNQTFQRIRRNVNRAVRHDHLILGALALVVGLVAGGAVIVFREAINWIQWLYYDTGTDRFYWIAQELPWWILLGVPTLGGLLVGVLVHWTLPDRRPHGIADVVEAYARRSGYMTFKTGVAAALASAASIGCGASVGREGPAVHLGASLAGWLTRKLHLSRSRARTVLGCGVSAAVAASFNAPLAGALFASEVIVGHYSLRSFAPIVISSVAGTVLTRQWYGDFPAFFVSETLFASLWEFPAFIILGVVSAIAAMVLMHGVQLAGKIANKLPGPTWYRPAIAGLCIGLIALQFPQVMGVGYGATESAMLLHFSFWTLVGIGLAKIVATSVCMGFGFAGGVFSPALVIGAMVGTSYGMIATQMFPDLSSGPDAYALVGMGAVAAAVLGAPISTTLIVFELTGDYALTLGVMVAVVIASEITQVFFCRSFFAMQLNDRGIDLKGEFEAEALKTQVVRQVMETDTKGVSPHASLTDIRKTLQTSPAGELFVVDDEGTLFGTITLADMHDLAFDRSQDDTTDASAVARKHAPMVTSSDDLGVALEIMQKTGEDHIAVVADVESMKFVGCVHHRDVMSAYNRALAQVHHEEHDL
jgi:chloride channel protein, CIC family